MSAYRTRLGQDVPEDLKPAVRRQILESLIRRELLVLEARRRNITATDADADVELRKDPFFNPGGKFDPARYDAIRTTQPENYRRALDQIKLQLAARTLNSRLEQEYVGNDPTIRTGATRALTRASLEYLALPRADFSGIAHEPREKEVLDAYRARAAEYRRPPRAVLTILQVDQPPFPEADLSGSAGRAWKERMRQRADSALTAARGGASFEDLARVCGSIRHRVEVRPDNFPGFWQGDARDRAAVFAASPGALLGTPVAGAPGWMVVRVDESEPARTASLAEVAPQIRNQLRTVARLRGDEGELHELYARESARFRDTGWRLRYAAFDTATVTLGEPAEAELDRWYRAHQADYSTFDAAAGRITMKPLDQVRDEVRMRWKSEQRQTQTHLAADQLEQAWSRDQRDRALERAAVLVREVGPFVAGGVVDTGLAARALSDTLARGPISLRSGSVRWARGWLTYRVYEQVASFVPPFEQVRDKLEVEYQAARAEEDERAARALYDQDPSAFASGQAVYYSRIVIDVPRPTDVPLTRAEVEAYHREHLDRYSAPEMIRVRHILVRPSGSGPDAEAAARKRAESLLARARSGEDFAELARRNSDDIATREQGGDLGYFSHGAMLEAFEREVFGLKPGQLSDVFRTEAGFDIVLCVDHQPINAQPLRYVYANVGWDAAQDKAESLTVRRVDSLAAALHSPAEALAASKKLGIPIGHTFHRMGDRNDLPENVPFLIRLEHTAPGHLVPGAGNQRGTGHFVAWVDSVAAAVTPNWETAHAAALERYRRQAGQRALQAKCAELDSMLASGWSLDSLAALFGGINRLDHQTAGAGLGGLGGASITDSLLFGTRRSEPALQPNQMTGWLDLPGGFARVKLLERDPPDPDQLAARIENDRRLKLEQKLYGYFEDLKQRYAVRILDAKLRDTSLPPPPPPRD
jgi:parvulin-like peptidyl-prolyl isomerase